MSTSYQLEQQNAQGKAVRGDANGHQPLGRPRTSGIAVRASNGVNPQQQSHSLNTSSNLYGINNVSAQSDHANKGTKNHQMGNGSNGLGRIALAN